MTRNVGERWEEYLRLGRRMSPHTVAAYLGDLHSLMEFLSLGTDATSEQLREADATRCAFLACSNPRGRGSALDNRAPHRRDSQFHLLGNA